jgi:exodeoxyribonuclease VII small subunit
MTEQPEPNFEEALTQVERIVADLERGEPALNTALAKYEDGVKLLRRCYELLDQAERSVALLTGVDEQGHPVTAPFDAAATLSPDPDPSLAPSTPGPKPRGFDRQSGPRSRALADDTSAQVPDTPF